MRTISTLIFLVLLFTSLYSLTYPNTNLRETVIRSEVLQIVNLLIQEYSINGVYLNSTKKVLENYWSADLPIEIVVKYSGKVMKSSLGDISGPIMFNLSISFYVEERGEITCMVFKNKA